MGKILLILLAAYVVYALSCQAWSGRIHYAKGKTLERAKEPIGFWICWLIGVALFSYAFGCWIGDVCIRR